jgi:subtilisin-like proprotein convertase family protein
LEISDNFTILDLDVQLSITHTRDADLDVYLVSPAGTRVELFSDVGGSGDNFQGTILDDEAGSVITSASAPFTGTYRPEGNLSDFEGESVAGTWQLEIHDDRRRQAGTLDSWSILVEHSAIAAAAANNVPRAPLLVLPATEVFATDGDFSIGNDNAVLMSNVTNVDNEISLLDSDMAEWRSPRNHEQQTLLMNCIRTDSRLSVLYDIGGRDIGKFTGSVATKLIGHADRDQLFPNSTDLMGMTMTPKVLRPFTTQSAI